MNGIINKYDLIIIKYALHFFENIDFIINALKPQGKLFALSLSGNSKLPWNNNIKNKFTESCNSDKKYPKKIYTFNKNIDASIYNNFLIHRSISDLYNVSDEDINESLSINEMTVDIIMEYYIIELDKNNFLSNI